MISVNLLFDLLSIAITLLSIKLFLHKYIFLLLRKLIEPYVVKLSVAESKTNRKNELSLVNKAQHPLPLPLPLLQSRALRQAASPASRSVKQRALSAITICVCLEINFIFCSS